MNVFANGEISTYQSTYRLCVSDVSVAGEGEWLRILRERSKEFEKRGYFSKKKREIPNYPSIIGIVTSPTGAVIHDMENRLRDRYQMCRVLLYPASVQGSTAAQEIANGVRFFNNICPNKPDVIIVARGGGSVEDLLPFSEEVVVRAIYESAIPVISAVGHETDTPLSDYAADIRVPTPTAAIERATPVLRDVVKQLEAYQNKMAAALEKLILKITVRINEISQKIKQYYIDFYRNAQAKIEHNHNRLCSQINNMISSYEKNIASLHIIPLTQYMQTKNTLLLNRVNNLINAINIMLNSKSAKIHAIRIVAPTQFLHNKKQRYDNIQELLLKNYSSYIKQHCNYTRVLSNRLEQSSYLKIMEKGFCYAYGKSGVIRKKADIDNEKFLLRFYDGEVTVKAEM